MDIRPAVPADLPALDRLYARARAFMAANGNPAQWGGSHPGRTLLEEDVTLRRGYVCTQGKEVLAAFAFLPGPEPTYQHIEDGTWPDERPYWVVHRLAAGGRKGAGTFCLEWCLSRCSVLRIDTHRDNRPMRQLLDKLGFVYCGVIFVDDGTPRLAYQRNGNLRR